MLPVIRRSQEKGACQYSSVVALHNGKGRQPQISGSQPNLAGTLTGSMMT